MTDDTRPLELTDEISEMLAGALTGGKPATVSYVGEDGWPHVSARGSTQVLGPHELAIWVRKRDEGLAQAVRSHPKLTVFYLDMAQPVIITFYGRGEMSDDPEVLDRVWGATPDREKAQDPQRRGAALVVDLERVVSRGKRPEQNFVMERR